MVSRNRCSRFPAPADRRWDHLLAAFIVLPQGQRSIAWISAAALNRGAAADARQLLVQGPERGAYRAARAAEISARGLPAARGLGHGGADGADVLQVLLPGSFTIYYTFFLIGKFPVSVESAQVHLFIFLAAAATGGVIGGPLGDRIGRKYIIWGSILGVLPFTLVLPHLDGCAQCDYRFGAGLGLRGDSGLRAEFVARQGRQHLWPVFSDWRAASVRPCWAPLADLTSIDFVYRACAFPASHRPAGRAGG
jgi:FSR family fosmidomycin resistance protein-like MFS transporter